MLSSFRAQQLLKDYSVEQIRAKYPDYNDFQVETLYLANLCARGDYQKVEDFLFTMSPRLFADMINSPIDLENGKTCLHVLLYWNAHIETNNSLFELLLTCDGEFREDSSGYLPWQQTGTVWKCPIDQTVLGERCPEQFTLAYESYEMFYKDLLDSADLHNYDNYDQNGAILFP